jgi:hypothetical protein
MSNTVTISCILDTSDASVPLGFEAWIDNQKFFDTNHVQTQQTLVVKIADTDREYELRFVLKNKTLDHTQVDAAGNIVSDATLSIANLSFDELRLGHIFVEQATYTHDFNGTGTIIQDKFYGNMGCNGTVSLKFATPIYLWLLEHM